MYYVALSLAMNFLPLHVADEDIDTALCLVEAMHYEANGEDWIGKKAVAHALGERVLSPRFPDTYCEVLHQESQFSHRNEGLNLKDVVLTEPGDLRSFDETMDIAVMYLDGVLENPVKGADHFFNPNTVSPYPSWAHNPIRQVDIGNHRFIQVYP